GRPSRDGRPPASRRAARPVSPCRRRAGPGGRAGTPARGATGWGRTGRLGRGTRPLDPVAGSWWTPRTGDERGSVAADAGAGRRLVGLDHLPDRPPRLPGLPGRAPPHQLPLTAALVRGVDCVHELRGLPPAGTRAGFAAQEGTTGTDH